jgi:hypothetical protein
LATSAPADQRHACPPATTKVVAQDFSMMRFAVELIVFE